MKIEEQNKCGSCDFITINKKSFQDLKKYTDNICRMLCEVMGEIEYQSASIVLDKDVSEWWLKHKEWDKNR